MSAQPWVIDQDKRLNALAECGLLDTPDEVFDRIVLRATQVCQTPIALISLIAVERQWFKARIGFKPSGTPIDQSICKYVLDQPRVLVIPDLRLDPRTANNTLVTSEPHLRFYAGARIQAADTTPIGSLCVIDTAPRPHGLSPVQTAALESLAYRVFDRNRPTKGASASLA